MSEIKSCPFCGSEVNEKDCIEEWYGWSVVCDYCDSSGANRDKKEDAIKVWNQRPYDFDMPAIVKKVQQLEELISDFVKAWDTGEIAYWHEGHVNLYRQMVKPCKQPE